MAASASKGAAIFAGQLAQTGANVDTWVQIPTGIDPGSGTVLELESFEAYLRNGYLAFSGGGDQSVMASVSRSPVVPSLANTDVFGMVVWQAIFGGTAASFQFVGPLQEIDLEPALTLQPYIYVCVSSVAAAVACVLDYRVTYTTSKVSQAEQLKLLAGGV